MKKFFSFFLRIIISIALLLFLFRQVDFKSIVSIIKAANKPFLLLALFIFSFSYILSLLRWEMLLKAVQIHLSLKRIIISFSGGIFFSLFLPSTIGGDLMRSIDLAAHTKKPKEVIATVLLDRLSGYAGLVILTLSALLFGSGLVKDTAVFISVVIITGILVGILFVLFNKFIYRKANQLLGSPNAGKIKEAIVSLHNEIHVFRHKEGVLFKNIILSILIQIITPLTFYVIALSMGVKINLLFFLIFIPVISAITLLPISIGGLGLRDVSTAYFFAKVGVSHDLAVAMSLTNFAFIIFIGAIGGLIYVFTVHHRRIQYKQPSFIHPRK